MRGPSNTRRSPADALDDALDHLHRGRAAAVVDSDRSRFARLEDDLVRSGLELALDRGAALVDAHARVLVGILPAHLAPHGEPGRARAADQAQLLRLAHGVHAVRYFDHRQAEIARPVHEFPNAALGESDLEEGTAAAHGDSGLAVNGDLFAQRCGRRQAGRCPAELYDVDPLAGDRDAVARFGGPQASIEHRGNRGGARLGRKAGILDRLERVSRPGRYQPQ